MTIAETVVKLLTEARKENRLVCGLKDTSQFLKESENVQHSLFFFIAPTLSGDSLTHIQEIVLQSFCFENDIYIIKLENAKTLKLITGSETDITCALVQKLFNKHLRSYSDLETCLIDYCEEFWDQPVQPSIRLPDV